ncbi:MAG: PIN domain-containing protein [Desulfobacteraceae bacterium]|nr:PIN domain-containing protein [Desulfobacteraceae bacterium]
MHGTEYKLWCKTFAEVLIYLYSEDEQDKRDISLNIVKKQKNIISTQVINEVVSVLHRKMKLDCSEINNVFGELLNAFILKLVDGNTIKSALSILERYSYSYWDSLIIASALENNCAILYTEDMQHNQLIEKTLKIVNPFST